MKTFYVTTPIYYVNDVPHVGHAYTTLAADVLARYYRGTLGGDSVFFLVGTDEHGANVAQAAEKNGQTPKEYVDAVSPRFEQAWKLLNFSPDFFIRTTDPRHEKIASEILQKIYDKGYIYEGVYEGWYCIGCERFLAESDMVDGKCPLHPTRKPVFQKEKNYFFKLKELSKQVLKKIKSGEYAIRPEERYNEIVSRLEAGVEDISISRAGVSWGVPVPWDASQTIYVWVEALFNYFTATQFLPGKAHFWPANVHFMAKDIVWFHSVIWQALLIATELPLPHTIFAHGFFTIDGQKMSKSLGNVISPHELVDRYGVDGARYLLLASISFGSDGDLSFSKLDEKYNADLANGLGNLVSRVLTLVEKNCEGRVPTIDRDPDTHPLRVDESIHNWKKSWADINTFMPIFGFSEVLESIKGFISAADRYINKTEPWNLVKEDKKEFDWVMYGLLDGLHQLAWQLYPFMPQTAVDIATRLNIKKLLVEHPNDKDSWTNIAQGEKISVGEPLFPRL